MAAGEEKHSIEIGAGDENLRRFSLLLKTRQKLGKYRIERRIADGPMAAVYAAVDTIHGTKVALKVPHESAMTDFFLADFKREARLAHRLEHPNILPIRDASFIDGRFVIAMPLGESSLEQPAASGAARSTRRCSSSSRRSRASRTRTQRA